MEKYGRKEKVGRAMRNIKKTSEAVLGGLMLDKHDAEMAEEWGS